jgi:hypothetical protein
VEKFLSSTYWTDVNLHGIGYGPMDSAAVALSRYSAPKLERPLFSDVVGAALLWRPANVAWLSQLHLGRSLRRPILHTGCCGGRYWTCMVDALVQSFHHHPKLRWGSMPILPALRYLSIASLGCVVAADFVGRPVHFLWDSGCEACIFSSEGVALQVGGDCRISGSLVKG